MEYHILILLHDTWLELFSSANSQYAMLNLQMYTHFHYSFLQISDKVDNICVQIWNHHTRIN
jgi:hypothetical protein